jgi:hypothetical protein
MKRITFYISILWLSCTLTSLAVPEINITQKQEKGEIESCNEESKDTENVYEISTSSEAIISIFQFEPINGISLIPKLFLEIENEEALFFFKIRDFSIQIWKKLFTTIIQVHGP